MKQSVHRVFLSLLLTACFAYTTGAGLFHQHVFQQKTTAKTASQNITLHVEKCAFCDLWDEQYFWLHENSPAVAAIVPVSFIVWQNRVFQFPISVVVEEAGRAPPIA